MSRTVWRVADNLEKTLLRKFLFLCAKLLKLYVGFYVKYNIEP